MTRLVILLMTLAGLLLAQPPAPRPVKPRVKVGLTEEQFKTLELQPGTYVSLSLSCADGECAATINGSASAIPGTVDFSGADHTIVAKVGTTPPATCTVGEWFYDSDEIPGANLKICTATNVWQPLAASYLPAYTIATLPAAGATGRVVVVTDAASAGSCTTGGGTALALCRDSGAAWVPLGDGGGGGGGSATSYIQFPAANCQYGVASTGFTVGSTGIPSPRCISGSNVITAALDFADTETQAVQASVRLMGIYTTVDLLGAWSTTATTGSVVWQVQTACVGDGDGDDPSWNTTQTITDAAKGTAGQRNDFSLAGLTLTGCSSGESLHLRFFRDPTHASDTLGATASLYYLAVVVNR